MKILSTFLAMLLLIPTISHAEPLKGSVIPSNLELMDETGAKRSFDDLTGENGAILVFYRSAKWCPFCQRQLIDLSKQQAQFEDKGYKLVGISYDSVKELKKFDDRRNIDFPLLSDEGSETIKAFGILNEKHKEGSFAYGVPHPKVYVVGADKKVKTSIAEEGYKKRPSVEVVLELLE